MFFKTPTTYDIVKQVSVVPKKFKIDWYRAQQVSAYYRRHKIKVGVVRFEKNIHCLYRVV